MARRKGKGNGASDQSQPTWSLQDFDIGKKLSCGKFARVYVARKKKTNYLVALKVLKKETLRQHQMAQYLQSEVQILSNLRHPNIVRLYASFYDVKNVYLILEYCSGGELWELLAIKGRFPERKVAKYILQLTSALMYIHKKNVIHRDIKPENLLLDCHDNLKLCDFGWSIHYDRKRPDIRRDTFCGTMAYIAPEMLSSAQHHKQDDVYVDVWALGVLTFELIVGSAPFEDHGSTPTPTPSQSALKLSILSQGISNQAKHDKLRENIEQIRFSFPRHNGQQIISKEAEHFIQQFLIKNPKQRMQLKQIPNHQFIQMQYQYLSQFQFFGIELAPKGEVNSVGGGENGVRLVLNRERVADELRKRRFAPNVVDEAMRIYQKQYGDNYNINRLMQIIKRLQASGDRLNGDQHNGTPANALNKAKLKGSGSHSRHRDLSLIELE